MDYYYQFASPRLQAILIKKSREGSDAKDLSVLAGVVAGFLFILSLYLFRRRSLFFGGPLSLASGAVFLILSALEDPRIARYDAVLIGLGFGGIAGALFALLPVRRGDAPLGFPDELSAVGISDLLSAAVAGLAGLGTVFALEALYLRAGVAVEFNQSLWIVLGTFFGTSAAALSAGLWLARPPVGPASTGVGRPVRSFLPERSARRMRLGLLLLAILPGVLLLLPPLDAYQVLDRLALGGLAGYPLTILLILASLVWPVSLLIRADAADLLILARLTAAFSGLAVSMLGLAAASMPLVLAGGLVCGAGLALATRVAPPRTVIGVLLGDRADRVITPGRDR